MAYIAPKDLDGYIVLLPKGDPRYRLQLGTDLLAYLAEPSNPILCEDIGLLIDGLVSWMQSSNYKVSSHAIDIMTSVIDRIGGDFKPYLKTVLPNVIDRLGDAKDTVREKAQILILKLLEKKILHPQSLLEQLAPAFAHKNSKIREEILRCLLNILNEHGVDSMSFNRFIPDIVKLLSDPTSTVRDMAQNTLVELYKRVGEKLRIDLVRRNIVPSAKMQVLISRFDEVRDRGELLCTARSEDYNTEDCVDRAVMQKPTKTSLGSATRSRLAAPVSNSAGSAGGVDEETFKKSFEDVPEVKIFSSRDIGDNFKKIQATISDPNIEWNKRADALKKIRSLVLANATIYEDFFVGLKQLEIPLQGTIKDLRSQVVREACITIAYLAQVLGIKFDRTAEYLLPPLINLVQNSAKIMATSGIVTIRFIIQYIHNPRLIPIITSNAVSSKSKDIRRSCCEFVDFILNNWPTHALEKQLVNLQDCVKKGIADADSEARVSSRRAFRGFRENFPEQADLLLKSLDVAHQKLLQGDGNVMSASSSNNNLASAYKVPRYRRASPISTTGSTENLSGGLQRTPSLPRSYKQRSGIPVLSRENSARGFRSNSAIDLQAAQRASARAQYAAKTRSKITSGTASLQGKVAQQARPRKPDVVQSVERVSRQKTRSTQSQPTSRSGSPSSRLYYRDHDSPRLRGTSGIPRSTKGSREASRETSPNRYISSPYRSYRASDRPPLSPASRPVLAQKILQQSREAESAFADAFNDSGDHFKTPRKSLRSDNHSDESETSSICSERSIDSFRRASESFSWSGSQQRLSSRELWEPCRDINAILSMCASTIWQERKDGLLSLQHYLSEEKTLNSMHLKYVTEIFTRMFMDAHTKGFSVFLDTLHEVIQIHKEDLHDWIYVLLQRIFLKMGTEHLTSVQSKLMTTLEIVRTNFPIALLIHNVYRFLVDPTQTPNARVKITVMKFMKSLCGTAEASESVAEAPAGQALQKIIAFSQDSKSVDLKVAAKSCIVAMWDCNTPMITMILSELPRDQQDVARSIVHHHMDLSATENELGSSDVNFGINSLDSPTLTSQRLAQETVYECLRKTTSEIQNYTYETKLDKDRDTTSHDSGISQMSVGNDKVDIGMLEERMEELQLTNQSGATSLPTFGTVNGIVDSNGHRSLDLHENDLKRLLEECTLIPNIVLSPKTIKSQKEYLERIGRLIENNQLDGIKTHFRHLLRILISHLEQKEIDTQIAALRVLAATFKCKQLEDYWMSFVELLTLKVLAACCNAEREVVREVENTVAAMSSCKVESVLSTLVPVIQTSSDKSELLLAIKMVTKVIDTSSHVLSDELISQIMCGLFKAVDHAESPVRKSTIFCLVALFKLVGEEKLGRYIAKLSGSKRKLLTFYINRSQSNPPENQHTSTS